MKLGFFVAGTDTGIGKTTASRALLRAFSGKGMKAAGMKPVSSGGDDASRLRQAGNVELPEELSNPYDFPEPLAPHIAARHAGIEIDLSGIVRAYQRIEADVVIVEGVGGLLVPLNEAQDMGDLARMLGLPVVLVVGMRLGAINHALLTLEAVKSRGLKLAGWVANRIDPEMEAFEEVLEAIGQRIEAPLLATLPYDPEENFRIDVSDLI